VNLDPDTVNDISKINTRSNPCPKTLEIQSLEATNLILRERLKELGELVNEISQMKELEVENLELKERLKELDELLKSKDREISKLHRIVDEMEVMSQNSQEDPDFNPLNL
jgi:DNA repair exonuclease SbcCD ATPase subunit